LKRFAAAIHKGKCATGQVEREAVENDITGIDAPFQIAALELGGRDSQRVQREPYPPVGAQDAPHLRQCLRHIHVGQRYA
jgi:hypothetical protein